MPVCPTTTTTTIIIIVITIIIKTPLQSPTQLVCQNILDTGKAGRAMIITIIIITVYHRCNGNQYSARGSTIIERSDRST